MDLILASMDYPPAVGGVERLSERFAHQLHAIGVSVHVLAPAMEGDCAFDDAAPYPVTRFGAGRMRQPSLALALASLARGGAPVLFGQWTAASLTLGIRALLGQPSRFASLGHGKELLLGGSFLRRRSAFRRYIRAVLGRLDLLVANSRYTAELARTRGAPRVRVINPGVELDDFGPDGPGSVAYDGVDGPRLLTVARLVPRKGVDTVIEALPELLRRHPNLRYYVAGDGPDRPRVQQLARQRGVADQVHFLGRVPQHELPALYRDADVMVLASRLEPGRRDVEGFGMVLLEAQASGTAVVACRCGGMPDAVVEGETGLLVREDDPDALSYALAGLLADRGRLETMGRQARRHAEGRTWDRAARELAAALRL